MILTYQPSDALPPLAWCALIDSDSSTCQVLCGSRVEQRPDHFFEGAWAGSLSAGRFDQAFLFTGSGARTCPQGVLFCAPTHATEMLWSVRSNGSLFVSNSLVFVLAASQEDLDPTYQGYFFDLVADQKKGLDRPQLILPTAGRRPLRVHRSVNLLVTSDLQIHNQEKPCGEPPRNYHEYTGQLTRALEETFANAADPGRRAGGYVPSVTISRGYDSGGVAVLAARAGCREGITYRSSGSPEGEFSDSGVTVGSQLGIRVYEHDRCDFRNVPGIPGAEFFPNPFCTDNNLASLQEVLTGRLLLTGRHGEDVWGTNPRKCLRPRLYDPCSWHLRGSTLTEFRLRIGMLNLPLAWCGALHVRDILRITHSKEMKPWRLGGSYDRPIPRRLLEEAGVPRGSFAIRKLGGPGDKFSRQDKLSAAGWRDFQNYLDAWQRSQPWPRKFRSGWRLWLAPLVLPLRRYRMTRAILAVLAPSLLHPFWGSLEIYTFQWGVSRLRDRYPSRFNQPI